MDGGAYGTVGLELTLSTTGAVEEVVVVQPSHPLLDQAAVQAARQLQFSPATKDGTPVAVRLPYAYHFAPPPEAPGPEPKGILSGQVRIRGTAKLLPYALLVRHRSDELIAEADAEGRFRVELPRQVHLIDVKARGYEPMTLVADLRSADALDGIYRLLPAGHPEPFVTIVRDDNAREQAARHTLQGREMKEVPGTLGDPFRAVMLMPGVTNAASGLAYPFVRGMQPAATGFFIDGVRIPMLYHLVAGHAVVHPELLERIDFYPGAPPPRFGRVLGGVVDAETRPLPNDRWNGLFSVDLLNAGGLIEAPLGPDTSFSASGRLSYTPFVLGLVNRAANPANQLTTDFADYQVRVEHRVGGGALRLFALGAYDTVGVRRAGSATDDLRLNQHFHRVDLRYQRPSPLGRATVAATWGYEAMGAAGGDASGVQLRAQTWAARASLQSDPLPSLRIHTGADFERRSGAAQLLVQSQGGTTAFQQPGPMTVLSSLWTQAIWQPDPAWTVTGGVRLDSYHQRPGIQHGAIDPSVTVHFQAHPSIGLQLGAGLMHQPPTVLLQVPTLDVAGLRYGLQEGAQVNGRFEWAALPGIEVTVDGYYTHLSRTFEFDLLQVIQQRIDEGVRGQDLAGSGRAYGVELMVRHPIGDGWFGWLSYSLQRSERLTTVLDLERYAAEGILESRDQLIPFAFDQTHTFNLALNKQFPGHLTFGGVLHFRTGRPETGQFSSRTMRVITDANGHEQWRPVSLDRVDRLPPFYRLDLRIAKRVILQDFQFEAYVELLNATFNGEVLYFGYTRDRRDPTKVFKEPNTFPILLPLAGVKGAW